MKCKAKVTRLKKRIDEEALINHLTEDLDVRHDNDTESILWMLTYCIVDAFDQEVSRESFINIVSSALRVNTHAAAARTFLKTKQAHERKEVSAELLERSMETALKSGNSYRNSLLTDMKQVQQCRGNDDPIN